VVLLLALLKQYANLLKKKVNLSTLKLGYNSFTSLMGDLLGRTLSEDQLVVLDLRFCRLGVAGTGHILRNLEKNSSIKELILSGNNTDKRGMQSLAEILKNNRVLEKLGLRFCNLDKNSFIALLDGVGNNTSVTSLDISYNKLNSMESCVKLGEVIGNLDCSIKELHLSECMLNSKHMKELSDAFADNRSLVRLHLDRNVINIHGLRFIVAGLKKHPCLQLLSLQNTNINTSDVIEVLRRLGKDDSLLEILDVRGNSNVIYNDIQLEKYMRRYRTILVKLPTENTQTTRTKIMNQLKKI